MNNIKIKEDLSDKIQAALDKGIEKLIAEEKKNNGYLVVTDNKGNTKKVPAKDL